MARHVELAALLLLDAIALILAYFGFRLLGAELGLLSPPPGAAEAFSLPSIGLLLGFWVALFLFAGLYGERYAASRFDEFVTVLKVVTLGAVLLFFLVFVERLDAHAGRTSVLLYGVLVLFFVGGGRLAFRSLQKALIVRGRGVHRAVIVGWSNQVENVFREVQRYPAAGLHVVGAVRLQPEPVAELAVAGTATVEVAATGNGIWDSETGGDLAPKFNGEGMATVAHGIAALPDLIERLRVQDVIIALGPNDHVYLDEVLRVCDGISDYSGRPVALKLVPDFYAAVGGMARTEHMYGLPLIEVLPLPTPAWERHAKRLIDIVVSLTVLLAGLPLWLGIAAAVRLSSHGPAIYRQLRVGEQGRPFVMYKYRTMQNDAERDTGPVWATRDDDRATPLGRWLRSLRVDEIPQFINVLTGEMSIVGPRPERPTFVERLAREIPLYSRRHRVKPGITGLAQVKWGYDQDIEDVRQKLKYDLLYIEHMSLRMDFQILLQTLRAVFERRGH